MKIGTRSISTITLMLLLFTSIGIAYAVPQQSHKFWGDVTIDGAPATDGILVEAKIAGITYESELTIDGKYGWTLSDLFYVPADDPDIVGVEGGVNGDTVEFYVGGILATTHLFAVGGIMNLDLAITTTVYELQLYEGWNLIGIPFIPEDPSIDTILYNILGYLESVWTYDGETGYWSSYSPYAPSDLTEILAGKGYWIKVSADVLWVMDI